jgi:beta-lactamase class A
MGEDVPSSVHWRRAVAAVLTAPLVVLILAAGGAPGAVADAANPICTSNTRPRLAARMSTDITTAITGRSSRLAIHVDDPSLKLTCSLNADTPFNAASTVKVLILAALLHKADVRHRALTTDEATYAKKMITVSNNYAAGWLWYDVGSKALQNFLNLAGMSETTLGSGDNWGETQETTHDESLLLQLLVNPNAILTSSDQAYELGLMASVVSTQRWGTPAGVGSDYAVHVKNGWLWMSGYRWIINSLGAFTKTGQDYTMSVLTDHNPTMSYGVETIEDISNAVNHDIEAASG